MMKFILILISVFVLSSCDFIRDKFSSKEKVDDKSEIVDLSSSDKNLLNGKVRYKFPSGKLKSIVNYKDNIKVGISHVYYESGEKQYEIPYVNGKKDGLVKWFYKSGKLYRSTSYKKGLKHGLQKKYWESGKIKSKMLFESNMMCTGLEEITKTGKVKAEPKIIVNHVNLLNKSNEYRLELSLDKKYRSVEFYIGKLLDDKCLPVKASSYLSGLETKKGKATFVINVPSGSRLSREIPIVAVAKTSYQNYYVLNTVVNVSVRNPN
ncbi:toxin-antitoxin system YwqK family antitoxin [Ancylomarina sp. 16SWW S1-10-2]|uniref:toxin-antitoxin system YwqK family antitoxin n=1 Tax=Ancylomarina sp. 16SWW S1-10-2 TaxID=2499681 RepID=UPI0012AE6861|nr:toxin-antitoxin system YwqK family antitoxin [Ancylomarina sp. 16SWW S1-10-2]MRT92669.1 toxin-antitoxin system YwqK family antitoxin [Ancylomarina sp. 16SWW S1-10-2]